MHFIPPHQMQARLKAHYGGVRRLLLFVAVMEDSARNILLSALLSLVFLGGVFAQGLEMEFISLEQKAQLERQFNDAKLAADDAAKLNGRKWTCDMYGVRSRMQVQRGVKLYSLKRNELGGFTNDGAQVISNYSAEPGSLSGKNSRFEDQVRMDSEGRLISRLSLRGATLDTPVIAYSICKAL